MLLWVLLAFICLVALLAIPIEIVFNVRRHEILDGSVSIGWLFGLLRAPLPINSSDPSSERSKKKIGREKKKRKDGGRRAILVIRNAPFRQRVVRFIQEFLRAINVTGLTLRARLGLDDPADTGMLWGFIGPLSGLLATIQNAVMQIELEFMYETFELEGKGKVRLIPLQFIFIVALFALSPVTMRMLWALR